MMSLILSLSALAQLYDAIEDRLPVLVASEVVIGDNKVADALSPVQPNQDLNIVRRPPTGFAPLHIDDRAERALERAPAAGVEACVMADCAAHDTGRQNRRRQIVEPRKVVEKVVDWLQLS